MKYLGSHNSMSYLPVQKWWMKFISFAARCQSKTFIEQYNAGVRIFDVRIKWEENNKDPNHWVFAHGLVSFKSDIKELFNFLESKGDTKVRLILEYNKPPKNEREIVEKFTEDCFHLKYAYPHIKFFEFRCKWNWNRVVFTEYNPIIDQQVGSMVQPISLLGKIWPWAWTKLHNKNILKNGTDSEILFIDFI